MTDSKNCMTDSKENYEFDLGVKGLKKLSLSALEEMYREKYGEFVY